MRKLSFLLSVLTVFSFSFAGAETPASAASPSASGGAAPKDDSKVSGIPRLIRDYPTPQVFLRDQGGSYQIPTGGDYNRIMNALNSAYSSRTPVNLVIDPKTKTIIDVVGAPRPQAAGSLYEDIPDDTANQKMGGQGGGAAAGATGGMAPGAAGMPAAGMPAASDSGKAGWGN